jgi:hypothetical protein
MYSPCSRCFKSQDNEINVLWHAPIFVGLPKANFEKIGAVRSEVQAEQLTGPIRSKFEQYNYHLFKVESVERTQLVSW